MNFNSWAIVLLPKIKQQPTNGFQPLQVPHWGWWQWQWLSCWQPTRWHCFCFTGLFHKTIYKSVEISYPKLDQLGLSCLLALGGITISIWEHVRHETLFVQQSLFLDWPICEGQSSQVLQLHRQKRNQDGSCVPLPFVLACWWFTFGYQGDCRD